MTNETYATPVATEPEMTKRPARRKFESMAHTLTVQTFKDRSALADILCCPACHGPLDEASCQACGKRLMRNGGQIIFTAGEVDTADAAFQAETQNNTSLKGRLFNIGKGILSSEYWPRDYLREFLSQAEGVTVELGSGSRRLSPTIVNVDLFPSKQVDVVADIAELPFRTGSVDRIILDSVIEHVPDPGTVVAEARRALKPGGRIFIQCPFMLPYHGYPAHYQNYTQDGLMRLLREFDAVEVRPAFGPMTAWVNITSETFAVLVGGERGMGYLVAKAAALLPIFWLKYLDAWFIRFPQSHRLAGLLCATAVR